MMDAGARQHHADPSLDRRSSRPQNPHSGLESATTAPTGQHLSEGAVARDSTLSHITTGGSSTTAGSRSTWSRSSVVSIDHSPHSRPGSTGFIPLPSPPSPSNRDSFISIVDDPFFQRLDNPTDDTNLENEPEITVDSSPSSVEDLHADSYDYERTIRWPPPRRESLTAGPSQYRSSQISAMESFNIAIIGSIGVGKSTFVQQVLGLKRPPISNASNVRINLDSTTHAVTLLELDLDSFDLSTSQPIQWPKQMNGHIVPRVDAALVIYDVTNKDTINDLPRTIAALTNSGLPSMMVASKCNISEDEWDVDVDGMAKHEFFKSCLAHYKISLENSEGARNCVHSILRAAVAQRKEENGEAAPRRRAQSAANLEAPDTGGGRPLSGGHSRASSDYSLLRGFSNTGSTDSHRKQASRSSRSGARLDKSSGDSFLDVDESDAESHRYSDDIPILQRNEDVIVEKQPKMAGVPFDELVDRLLALRLSKSDINFSDIFLCLYRKFAAPGELFSAILSRLDHIRDDKSMHHLTKTATQLRIIETIAKWVALYPGDFARSATRRNLEEFIRYLSTEPIFCIAARQMRRNLTHHVMEDDDTGWANADDADDEVASNILSKELGEIHAGIGSLHFDDDVVYGRPSGSSENLNRVVGTGGQIQLYTLEDYEREAATLDPTDHLPMNKFRYRIFMEIKDDDVADELTRIDWIMFSSIRIRDFVRHVSLSASQKENCKSLKNVNRMINHFNHIAKWVANMILLRDKAKHRALILEKFMNIAIKLRQLNNYNGLAAVLAGINGTAIHRLGQTKSLVSAEIHKKFARLVILMGTQKSHFAYRLAWENSPLPRIPFMPLHRRDLVSAEEGSKTFVGPNGDRVNWKKFEVLGEVLLPLMKSQGTPYPNLAKNDNVREFILGCHMPTDEEEIYQRSLDVESSASVSALDPAKKIFPWFNK